MVSRNIVLETVKRMYSSGVDDDTVITTLKDIGISDEEIKSVIDEAKGITPAQGKPLTPPQPTGRAPLPLSKEEREAKEGAEEEEEGSAEEESGEEGAEQEDEETDEDESEISGIDDLPAEGETEPEPKPRPLPKEKIMGAPLPKTQEQIAKRTAEHVGEHIKSAQDDAALRDTALHATIGEQAEKLEQLSKGIEQLQKSADTGGGNISGVLNKRLNEMQKDIGEIKGATSALQDLLKKILATNRSILIKLEKKKR